MANPVLTSITPASPTPVAAGATVTMTTIGTDADAHSETYGVALVDDNGNTSNVIPHVFEFADPLHVVVTQPPGSIGVVTLAPGGDPMKFTVTSPN